MKRSLNLMSERARKRKLVRSSLRIWSRVVMLVLIVLAVSGLMQWNNCHQEEINRESAEADYQPIRQLKIENGRLKKQIAAILEGERIPLELAKHQPLLSLIGLATRGVAEQRGKLFLTHLEIERDPLPNLPSKQTSRQSNLTFVLDGITANSAAVTQLADLLRTSGPFAEVEQSTKKSTPDKTNLRQDFTVQCTN